MDRSRPRPPSPWWVLVPGVLLALVGARAVIAEMDRAQADARDAARAAGRAIATLVDEYGAPLAEMRSVADVAEGTRHLYPVWLLRPDGGTLLVASADDAPDEAARRRDATLQSAVRERAAKAIPEVAAALFAATADAVEAPSAAAALRIDAAAADLEAGDGAEALEELRAVLEPPAATLASSDAGPAALAEPALRLLLAATGPGDAP